MDNSTTISLQGNALLANQLELVSTTTVSGVVYGIAFTLFYLYVSSLVPQLRDGDRKRRAWFMLGYSTVLMLCGLYDLVANAWVTQNAYIKHGNYPGSPLTYIETTYHSRVIVVGLACQLAIGNMTSAIQVWRVWVIWRASRYAYLVTVLPVLCFLTNMALGLRIIILKTTLSYAESFQLGAKTEIVGLAVEGVTTIVCTMSIACYLIFKQWQQRKLIGEAQGSSGYTNVVAMLIESYALESTWLLVGAILWNNITSIFFIEPETYIQIIAYLLVQYRVASGKAYESQREQRNISSLRWNHSHHATTLFGEVSEMHSGPHVSTIPEVSSVPRVSTMT